jgi:p21-activated kinase 2
MGNKIPTREMTKDELWVMKNESRETFGVHSISMPENLKQGIKVKYNEEGKFEGLPNVWVNILKLSPHLVEETVDIDDLEDSVVPDLPDDNLLNCVYASKPGKFIIIIQSESEEQEIPVESSLDSKNGFLGLPEEWNEELSKAGFTKQQAIEDPIHILETIGLIQRVKAGSIRQPLPTNSEYRKIEKEKIVFIKSEPSEDFTILEDIGEGGFGKVYKCARKGESDKFFAMKYIDITSSKQKIYIGNEITIMKHMDHKNIVQLYEVYMFKGRIFMIMEYLDGGCLTPVVEYLKIEVPETVIAYIIREVLEGIASLHKRGIIHRDIKSDNVLIDRETGDIKITDFGYSCQLTQEKRMRESRVGTLYWMAPEVLKGNNQYDER